MWSMLSGRDCLFCQIVEGKSSSEKVWEDESFLAIKNKYPKAPIHLLVLPKKHESKAELVKGGKSSLYDQMMEAVFAVVRDQGLDKTGYKLVNNGGGYNHFDHEHIHVMGGSKTEPGGES